MFSVCSLNGRIVPFDSAAVSLANVEYAYGFGVYENIRVTHNVPYFLGEHAERLLHSATLIDLVHPYAVDDVERFVRELLEQISVETINLKILLIGAQEEQDVLLAILPLAPFFPEKKWYREGVKTITVPAERPLPQAKTLSMLPSYLAYRQARRNDAYDALLVDRNGNITEGTRTNFFVLDGSTIVSPPTDAILSGVTRAVLLETARKEGFNVIERPIPLSSLKRIEAAFLTSTSAKVLPIRQVNEQLLVVDDRHHQLLKLYDARLDDLRVR